MIERSGCTVCGGDLQPVARGRPRKYCSARCRRRARPSTYVTTAGVRVMTPVHLRVNVATACFVCGSELHPAGGRLPKYCSDRCRWAYWTTQRLGDRRTRARAVLYRAVQRGTIDRPDTCEQCGGGGQIDGHHHDYALPLAVAWLCPPCHELRHPRGLPDVRLPLEPART